VNSCVTTQSVLNIPKADPFFQLQGRKINREEHPPTTTASVLNNGAVMNYGALVTGVGSHGDLASSVGSQETTKMVIQIPQIPNMTKALDISAIKIVKPRT